MSSQTISRTHLCRTRSSSAESGSDRGFTIVEVLIALTLSLLLMLSLTQAFKYLSERIRENRTTVELSTRLNNVVNLLEEDLKYITVPLVPQTFESQHDGYFVYYEGPGTDATSILFGAQPTAAANTYYRDSRFGDIDDYIAFTAYNPNKPFRGFVPKYILLANSDPVYRNRLLGTANPPLTAAEIQDAIQPATITSHYAEIVYFVRPSYITEAAADGIGTTGPVYTYDNSGNPNIQLEYPDEGAGYPFRLTLHRRVLLIRPDLNLPAGALPQLNFPVGNSIYTFMQPDPWPVDPVGAGTLPRIIRAGQNGRAWQIGMTPVHQQCDLSVRWVLDATGRPTTFAAANSLADLTIPHNRFGHVRAPAAALGFPNPPLSGFSSMPILAVGSQMPYIAPGLLADGNGNRTTFDTFLSPGFSGFLRPEFALGLDFTHTEVPGTFWGRERLGDDVLSTEMLAFDVQGFDPLAPVAFGRGPDGQPGNAGVDDDGNGTNDNLAELGAPNSDDTILTPSDPYFFQIARTNGTDVVEAYRGEFIDLAYDRLAGGAMRVFAPLNASALKANRSSSTPTALNAASRESLRISDLSGFRNATNTVVLNQASLPFSLMRSGKAIRNMSNNTPMLLFQPTYDTYTVHYERDGFHQFDLNRAAVLGNPTGALRGGTVWWFPNADITPAQTDRGADGIDSLSAHNSNPPRYTGVDSMFEKETSAPFEAPLPAIRVRIRVQDQASGVIQQQSVVADSF